jgi:hypothetical protein
MCDMRDSLTTPQASRAFARSTPLTHAQARCAAAHRREHHARVRTGGEGVTQAPAARSQPPPHLQGKVHDAGRSARTLVVGGGALLGAEHLDGGEALHTVLATQRLVLIRVWGEGRGGGSAAGTASGGKGGGAPQRCTRHQPNRWPTPRAPGHEHAAWGTPGRACRPFVALQCGLHMDAQ